MNIKTTGLQSILAQTSSHENLVIDCDGVALDFLRGFIPAAEEKLGRTFDKSGPDDFNLSNWLGVTEEEVGSMIGEFNSGVGGHFSKLPPVDGAVAALQAAHAQGRIISMITACSTSQIAISMREQNLLDVFGDIFQEIHFVDLKASKRPQLELYKDVVWVEDKWQNALLGAEIGHKSYLIRESHNVEKEATVQHANLTWVDGWAEICHAENIH